MLSVELDGPDLDVAHLNAPSFGLGVEDALDVGAKLLALGQHLVELMLAQYGAQRRLCEHVGGWKVGLDPYDCTFRIDDIEVKDRVHLHGDVVTGNHVLGRNLDDLDA